MGAAEHAVQRGIEGQAGASRPGRGGHLRAQRVSSRLEPGGDEAIPHSGWPDTRGTVHLVCGPGEGERPLTLTLTRRETGRDVQRPGSSAIAHPGCRPGTLVDRGASAGAV